MAQLIADRFLAGDSGQTLDLATGQVVGAGQPAAGIGEAPPLLSLIELLGQGREGSPRWLHTTVPEGGAARLLARAALDASSRGYVPVSVDVYLRLRMVLEEVLGQRSMLLLATPNIPPARSRDAFIDAAARSARPHVLLTVHDIRGGAASVVREARSAYGVDAPRTRPLPVIDADVEYHLKRAARAAVFVLSGRHAAAERLLRDVAGALGRRRRFVHASRVLVQLGQRLLERGRAGDAERVFEEAAAAALRGSDEGLTVDARLWQAAARTDAGRFTDAEGICRALLAAGSLHGGRGAWAHAVLIRVLLWQGRVSEAAELDLTLPLNHDLDAPTALHIRATGVRLLLAGERVFDAGTCAGRLMTDTVSNPPGDRLVALNAYLRFLAAAGALDVATTTFREIAKLAKETRAPLRAVRARVILASAFLRAARKEDVCHHLRHLERWRPASPVVLQRSIDALLQERQDGPSQGRRTAPLVTGPSGHCVTAMVNAAQEESDDLAAVRRVLALIEGPLGTGRIDVCSADAGPVSTLASVGSGLPTTLAGRVIETGLTLGPEAVEGGRELGVPVRRGLRLVGGIVARWPADRVPPSSSRELLEIASAVAGPRLESAIATARPSTHAAASVPELIGVSPAIDEVRTAIVRAAAAPFSVMILGESGVGKELAARAIHQLGPRRERRFCDINCAALPDELFESELFGHARGAFTGAVADRPGLFEEADGGTVFLDELADLSLRAQAKLLRMLQQQEVRRVGETFSRKVDVRLVTAANRDLAQEAANGRFRQDLLYRLDVIRIWMPPLRGRPGDISLLARHFWQVASARVGTSAHLSHAVLTALARYHWPGNVRELQNVLAALAVAAPARGEVRSHLLPAAIAGATAITSARLADARAQFEKRAIESALARAGGSRTRAARELGLSRQGLIKMMGRLGVK